MPCSQLFRSKEFQCGDEVLTIAAMTAVQVSTFLIFCTKHSSIFKQDVFVIPDGAAGALAELERRKFTAEEGVRVIF